MDNIKIDLGDITWIVLAQDRDQWRGSCQQGNEP
jgi:hypothetical protein